MVFLNAIQTDCRSRPVGWPSRAHKNAEVFVRLPVAVRSISRLLLPHSNKPTLDFVAKNTKLFFHFINLHQNSPVLTARPLRQELHIATLRRTSGRSVGIIPTCCCLLSIPHLTFLNRTDLSPFHLHSR